MKMCYRILLKIRNLIIEIRNKKREKKEKIHVSFTILNIDMYVSVNFPDVKYHLDIKRIKII